MHKIAVREWEHLSVLNRVWEGEMDPKWHLTHSHNNLESKPISIHQKNH